MTDYSTTKALTIVRREDLDGLEIREYPVPELKPHELLIENVAVAQNPGDWKLIAYNLIPTLETIGSDIAGTVVRVGSGVTKFKVGDKVFSLTSAFSETPRHGGYQTLTITLEGRTIHLPPTYSYEQAATIPQAFITSACAIVSGMKLPLDIDAPPKNEPFLVWGGSSSCGAYAVQLAKLAGYTVLATASPANHDYVRSLGVSQVFDYRDADVVSKIRAAAGPKLSLVIDAIGETIATTAAAECITTPTGLVATVMMYPGPNGEFGLVPEELKAKFSPRGIEFVHAWTFHLDLPGVREPVISTLEKLVQSGKLIPNPVKVLPGGLRAVSEGLKLAQANKVSGEKLVYRIAETQF